MLEFNFTRVESVRGQVEQGRAGQAPQGFVHGGDSRIGPCLEGTGRKFLTEVEVRTVRLIHDENPIATDLFHCGHVKVEAIIGRVGEVHHLYLRGLTQNLSDLSRLDGRHQVPLRVVIRLHIVGASSSHLEANMQGYVAIALNKDFFPCEAGCQNLVPLS
jgi:hypothetical protein